ncbi:MAG: DNA translocase FtsK 4TM domain-containing protein [Planctomycetota bacterium]
MAKKKASKKKTATQEQPSGYGTAWTFKVIGLVAASLVWVALVAALVSHDPNDPGRELGAIEGVLNETPKNWLGPVGAVTSQTVLVFMGWGAWVLVGAAGFALITLMRGRPVTHWPLRAIGAVLVAAAVSTGAAAFGEPIASWFGAQAEVPAYTWGGMAGSFFAIELGERFAGLGTAMIAGAALVTGLVLAVDEVVLMLPYRAAAWIAGKLTGVPLPDAKRFIAIPGAIVGWFRLPRREKPELSPRAGLSKDKADRLAELRAKRAAKQAEEEEAFADDGSDFAAGVYEEVEEPDEAEGEDDEEYEYEYVDEEASDDDGEYEYDGEEQAEEDDEEGADAPGAYVSSKRKFDPDELRKKMAQLPINFAPRQDEHAPPPREVDLSGYQFPGLDLLEEPEGEFTDEMDALVREQAVDLESALRQYRIEGEVVGIDSGPTITLFDVRLAPGTKVARLNAVSPDLARAMRAQNVRIVANQPGKDTVGVEVPNLKKETVRIKELMSADPGKIAKMTLPMFLGKDASGTPLVQDLGAMPHLLIAGTTGSGKSVCMNSIIASFLFTKRPDELKLVLVDPKMVEMSQFRDIPHLMCPVVTEMAKATAILEWAVTKMDERYELLAEVGVRDIKAYNELGWEEIKDRLEIEDDEQGARIPKKLPFLVFVIDELADLMMTNKEVEAFIVRIAQKARAVGIHLILATQRPQANVVTGLIKSNMPARIAFKVSSGMDSRIVLDQKGGELLLGQGDMLFLSPRSSKLTRAQGVFVDDGEIRRMVKFLKGLAMQNFEPQLMQLRSEGEEADLGEREPEFDDAVEVVLERQKGSVSLIQRALRIGYGKASRVMEQMAAAGIVEPSGKAGQERKVLIGYDEWEAMKEQAARDAALADGAEDDEAYDEGELDEADDLTYEPEEDAATVPDELDDEYRQ